MCTAATLCGRTGGIVISHTVSLVQPHCWVLPWLCEGGAGIRESICGKELTLRVTNRWRGKKSIRELNILRQKFLTGIDLGYLAE